MNHWLYYFSLEEFKKIKEETDLYEKAKKIVDPIFKNDFDKGGTPYLEHLYYVSNGGETLEEKVVGLLHDIIEDKNIIQQDLLEIGFPLEIAEVVDLLSRDKNKETYSSYMDRVIESNNITVLRTKRRDMEHNMDLSRIPNPTEKDYQRTEKKYAPQYRRIKKAIEKKEKVAC